MLPTEITWSNDVDLTAEESTHKQRAVVLPWEHGEAPGLSTWKSKALGAFFKKRKADLLISKPKLTTCGYGTETLRQIAMWIGKAVDPEGGFAVVSPMQPRHCPLPIKLETALEAHIVRETGLYPFHEFVWVHTRARPRAARVQAQVQLDIHYEEKIITRTHNTLRVYALGDSPNRKRTYSMSSVLLAPRKRANDLRPRPGAKGAAAMRFDADALKDYWPTSVLLDAIGALTRPGEWVVDPAMTQPDTLIAALLAGCNFLGVMAPHHACDTALWKQTIEWLLRRDNVLQGVRLLQDAQGQSHADIQLPAQ
jgi:hypothetical protein